MPMSTMFHGDLVFRGNATLEQRLGAVAALASEELHRPVHFEKRKLTCDVIIASGSAKEKTEKTGSASPVFLAGAGPPNEKAPGIHTPAQGVTPDKLPAMLQPP